MANEVFVMNEDVLEKYNGEGGDVVIPDGVTSIGEYAFYGCTGLKSVTIPDSVTEISRFAFRGCKKLTSVTIPDGVTSIGYRAFYHCTSLSSVTIPNSVTKIGNDAFSDCTGLKNVYYTGTLEEWCRIRFYQTANPCTYGAELYINGELLTNAVIIPNTITSIGDNAFCGCKGLTSVTIPDSVTSIGSYAFRGCTRLVSVTIPNSVISIEVEAFQFCTGLKNVYYTGTLEEWCRIGFGSSANPCTNGASLFIDGNLLTNAVIPDSVTSIGEYAFKGCMSLTSVTIPDSVKSIGANAFQSCKHLVSVTFPAGLTRIGPEAFSGCKNLMSVTLPDNVQIFKKTFPKWTSLQTSQTVPIQNPEEAERKKRIQEEIARGSSSLTAQDYASYFKFKETTKGYTIKKYIGADTSVIIPEKIDGKPVVGIGENAFLNCKVLKSVTIPGSVGRISAFAFSACSSLDDVKLSKGLVSIGRRAFESCTGLTSVTFPDSVTSIGEKAFSGCTSLTDIVFPESVTRIDLAAFSGCKNLSSATFYGNLVDFSEDWYFGHPFGNCSKDLVFHASADSTAADYAQRHQIGFEALPGETVDDHIYVTAGLSVGLLDAAVRRVSDNDVETLKTVCAAGKQDGSAFRTLISFYRGHPKVIAETDWATLSSELKEHFLSKKIGGCFDDLIIDYELSHEQRPPLLNSRTIGGWVSGKAKNKAKLNGTTLVECKQDGYSGWLFPYYRATVPKGVTAIESGVFASYDGNLEITWNGTVAEWLKIDVREDLYRTETLVVCTDGTVQYWHTDHIKTEEPLYVCYCHFGCQSRIAARDRGFRSFWSYIYYSQLSFLEMGGYLPHVGHDQRTQEEEYDLHDIDNFVKIPYVDVEHG